MEDYKIGELVYLPRFKKFDYIASKAPAIKLYATKSGITASSTEFQKPITIIFDECAW